LRATCHTAWPGRPVVPSSGPPVPLGSRVAGKTGSYGTWRHSGAACGFWHAAMRRCRSPSCGRHATPHGPAAPSFPPLGHLCRLGRVSPARPAPTERGDTATRYAAMRRSGAVGARLAGDMPRPTARPPRRSLVWAACVAWAACRRQGRLLRNVATRRPGMQRCGAAAFVGARLAGDRPRCMAWPPRRSLLWATCVAWAACRRARPAPTERGVRLSCNASACGERSDAPYDRGEPRRSGDGAAAAQGCAAAPSKGRMPFRGGSAIPGPARLPPAPATYTLLLCLCSCCCGCGCLSPFAFRLSPFAATVAAAGCPCTRQATTLGPPPPPPAGRTSPHTAPATPAGRHPPRRGVSPPPGAPARSCACPPAARPRNRARKPGPHPRPPRRPP